MIAWQGVMLPLQKMLAKSLGKQWTGMYLMEDPGSSHKSQDLQRGASRHPWTWQTQLAGTCVCLQRTRTQAASALRLAGNRWSLAGFHQPGSPTCSPSVLGRGAEGIKASLQWGCADCRTSGPMAVLAMC